MAKIPRNFVTAEETKLTLDPLSTLGFTDAVTGAS